MKIYITHSTNFDFKNELYIPIRNSELNDLYEITLPHEHSDIQKNSKKLIKDYHLIIAEVSYPSTGQGIELGWADLLKIPILCIYKTGSHPSTALNTITNNFIEYSNKSDMIKKVTNYLKNIN